MYLHKENRTVLNISLDDSNGMTQMDSVAAYKLVDNYMKHTGLMYEIYHHTMSVRGGSTFMPFSALKHQRLLFLTGLGRTELMVHIRTL